MKVPVEYWIEGRCGDDSYCFLKKTAVPFVPESGMRFFMSWFGDAMEAESVTWNDCSERFDVFFDTVDIGPNSDLAVVIQQASDEGWSVELYGPEDESGMRSAKVIAAARTGVVSRKAGG